MGSKPPISVSQDYKVVATINFRMEAIPINCLDEARRRVETILDCNPQGEEYDGFTVQIDVARMRDRKKMRHIKEFPPDEVLSKATSHESKYEFEVNGLVYNVKMNSDRYLLFQKNRNCVVCGLEGTKMMLDINPGDNLPHFNLYGEENGRLVLMTKDHIVPKSKGGKNELDNYATCCSVCNNLKGDADLTWEDVNKLRVLSKNKEGIPAGKLRQQITTLRQELAAPLVVTFRDNL